MIYLQRALCEDNCFVVQLQVHIGNAEEKWKRKLDQEKRASVAKVQKQQMTYKVDLAAAKKDADRRSDRDWIAYNKKMDAREKHQKQLIVKRNKELAITQKKVGGLSGGGRSGYGYGG